MEEAVQLVAATMPNSVMLGISEKLKILADTPEISGQAQYKKTITYLYRSFELPQTASSYNLLSENFDTLTDEIKGLLDSATNIQAKQLALPHIINKCLILFRARIFLEPNQLHSCEYSLLKFIKVQPEDLDANDLHRWLTTVPLTTKLKYNKIQTDILKFKKHIDTQYASIIGKEDQFKETAKQYLHEFKFQIDESANHLADSFESFKKRKHTEKNISLSIMIGCAMVICIIVISAISSSSDMGLKLLATGKDIPLSWVAINGWSFILMTLVIIYFFRIALNNYHSSRDEALQLELREALCRFIPAYRIFAEDNKCNLDEFTKHIFSPLNSRTNPTPHPLDFFGQLTDTAKKVTKN